MGYFQLPLELFVFCLTSDEEMESMGKGNKDNWVSILPWYVGPTSPFQQLITSSSCIFVSNINSWNWKYLMCVYIYIYRSREIQTCKRHFIWKKAYELLEPISHSSLGGNKEITKSCSVSYTLSHSHEFSCKLDSISYEIARCVSFANS